MATTPDDVILAADRLEEACRHLRLQAGDGIIPLSLLASLAGQLNHSARVFEFIANGNRAIRDLAGNDPLCGDWNEA